MEEEKIFIKRKDGIEYYKSAKAIKYDTKINLRIEQTLVNDLKQIANAKNIKYQSLIRMILKNYVDENLEGKNE